ncbi:MAG: hypothetical protein ABI886_14465 [Betaproteobacteria bacterium]
MRTSLCIAAMLGFGISSALAGPQCNQQTTRGNYAFACEGELPRGVPTRSLGTCTAGKSGDISCKGYANLGGQIVTQELHGQANNNADCTGTVTYANTINGQPAGVLEVQYVILDGGDTLKGLPTNSGGVLACILNRMGGGDDR